MWMALAAEYNDSRDPAWRERDFDSLRRKFRKLYGKANPTGNQGDRLTLKQRAILMAHETQYEIEKKGGAHTSHDGRDNGEDDENLMDEVNVALFADEVGKPFTVKPNSVSTKGGGDSNRARIDKQQEDDEEEVAEEDDESVSSVNSVNDEKSSEEANGARSDRSAASATTIDARSTPKALARPTPVTPRAVGRPKRDCQPLASVASPDGPTLTRNPDRAASDAAEAEKHKRLHNTSDRLGGRDLRVLRDNFEVMGGRDPGAKAKSPPSESSVTAMYAASKRNQAKKHMDSIDKELKEAEAADAAMGSEMKDLLLFFREDADRRAESEGERRREERDKRRAEDKRERDERERVRREEAALVEARRQQDREDAKQHLEAEEKKEEAARAERREEEAERRRQFQARLEQHRAEARQRHEQMMLLISTIHKNK
ncbi:hypothetical protein PHYSODRAFT_250540 [Phytophthora sojae]|uniref:DUF6818 domain-containing protein n=1 Tax=Phytophthora sojae (strain P6497) TaxID=1094619 RepID=G4ZVR5_PHYSP|nr:hypothetical protein PHYSODRAFT_250540 [Phytophthora sojae]EGZ11529.1 hypothetical protein PHYSODRAFT_250540 [Phytophthora sojae]|eukprot:XP_009531862.1 hypothetical protein PHYSODRAFT_250540 [Phytophthora sojae]